MLNTRVFGASVGSSWLVFAALGCGEPGSEPVETIRLQLSAPVTPTITEPHVDGQLVNRADVHMETAPFQDPDPGQQHLCSDWEITRA